MISAEKIMNIKVIELNKIYNFYFGQFFIRQNDSNIAHKIYISLLLFMKLQEGCVKFVNNVIATMSDDKMTKIKVVDLENL